MFNEKDQLAIDTIRALSIDAIEKQIQDTLDYLWSSTYGVYFMDAPP